MSHPYAIAKHDGVTRAGLDAYEERVAIYSRDGGRCRTCGELVRFDAFQLAHGIAATKANYRRFGARIIDHPKNRHVTCPTARCNDAQNIGSNPEACAALVREIEGAS